DNNQFVLDQFDSSTSESSALNQESSALNQPESSALNQPESSALNQPESSVHPILDRSGSLSNQEFSASTLNQEFSTSHKPESDKSRSSIINKSGLSTLFQDDNNDKCRLPLCEIQNIQSHKLSREYANKSLVEYRTRMKDQMLKKNKHPLEYSINDYVCIAIPKIDRNSIDRPTLPCKVIEELPNQTYRLQCKNGILNTTY
ncbi:15748_t:CDS:2, partial [Racocetra persica]